MRAPSVSIGRDPQMAGGPIRSPPMSGDEPSRIHVISVRLVFAPS